MTIRNLDFLRELVSNVTRQAAPAMPLVGPNAERWAAEFAYSRVAPSGERVGVRREGIVAAHKLARAFAKGQARYQRGTHTRTLMQAILDSSMRSFDGRKADIIGPEDLTTLERGVSEWFSENVMPRTYFVPCAIIPDLGGYPNARSFAIGPVIFSHISVFAAGLKNDFAKEIHYGPMIKAMDERRAKWVAQVEIDGCEAIRALETANLAVDIALAAIQLIIPFDYSRNMARLTGRTIPPDISTVFKAGSQTLGSRHWQDPGCGLSGGVFDEIMNKNAALVQSVGRRIDSYVRGQAKLGSLEQSWCDAAYWFHEGLAEPVETIAIAKLETAMEVLLAVESTDRCKHRLCEAIHAFFGLSETDPLPTNPSTNIKKFVEEIVGARSRVLHGTLSTLTESPEITREIVEAMSLDFLRRCTIAIDGYGAVANPTDAAKALLKWIDAERQASTRT
jgi:hypothetical protein